MSGAWELKKQKQVLVGILHTDVVPIAWAFGFRNLQVPGIVFPVAGRPYDDARNEINRVALENDFEWVFHLDSVPDYTPILIRRNGLEECIPICDLAEFTGTEKEYVQFESKGVEVFVGERNGMWAKIKHVLRHPFDGELYRINTHSGVVDVSANHSVMRAGGPQQSIAGKDIKVGMQLSMPRHRGRHGGVRKFFFGSPELAWFYGFFAAEGSACGGNVHVDNNNESYLIRCQEIFRTFFGKNLNIRVASTSNREIETKRVGTAGPKIYEFFRSRFYNSLGQKKVPIEILNAPDNIKKQFLAGYYDGDGHTNQYGSEQFSCNSPTLVLGIQWLIQTATRQTYSVQIRPDKPNIVGVVVNPNPDSTKESCKQKRPRNEVKKVCTVPYKGFLYDIETDKHVFAGGVGPILLHNSDVVCPNDTILRLMAHNLPIVSGVYYRRSPPSSVPVMIKNGGWITEYPQNTLIEVDWCGAGCLLLHRSLLEMYQGRPGHRWFDWRVNYRSLNVYPDETCMSEDFTFMSLLKRDHGISTYVDTSIQCRHVGWGESRQGVPPGFLIPAEAATQT